MSTDATTTKNLMKTLEDGRTGFLDAAEKLAESDRPDVAPRFRDFADQRQTMYDELERLAAAYGDDLDEDGSVKAAIHRGWMAFKDAVSGSSPKGVLDAAEQGEDHTTSEYREALEKDLSPDLAVVVRRQLVDLTAVHDEVKRLRDLAA